MTWKKDKFKILKKQKDKVTLGDNASGNILGKSIVSLGKAKPKNVLLVENLKPILLSVSQTCDQGHIHIFDSQKCEIKKEGSGKMVGIAPRTSENVYILNTKLNEKCHLNLMDDSWLCHRRLGHINFDNLVNISKLGAVRNLPRITKPSNPICKHFQLGKQTRKSFRTK